MFCKAGNAIPIQIMQMSFFLMRNSSYVCKPIQNSVSMCRERVYWISQIKFANEPKSLIRALLAKDCKWPVKIQSIHAVYTVLVRMVRQLRRAGLFPMAQYVVIKTLISMTTTIVWMGDVRYDQFSFTIWISSKFDCWHFPEIHMWQFHEQFFPYGHYILHSNRN